MRVSTTNLLRSLPGRSADEITEDIIAGRGVRLERIVSYGQATPPGNWYDQDQAEWVMVLSGRAGLLIEGEAEERTLEAGDAVFLPSHCRHRVSWTDPNEATIWLALFLDDDLLPDT
ncbi:MAG: cupin domain-containing protein [Hyphomicrobiaceae bacterium]